MNPRRALAGVCLLLLAANAQADITTANGWQNAAVTVAPAHAYTGGMDILPNGNAAVYDGTAIVEIDPSNGNIVDTLYTPPGPFSTFGNFVRVDPTGSYLLFGASRNIHKVPLDGSPATLVATIPSTFSCVFMAPDQAVIAHSFGDTILVLLDVATGAIDTLATISGPAGGVAFDAAGNLYYGRSSGAFPVPPAAGDVIRFSAAQVASAIGPSSLLESSATVFATGLDMPRDLVFDEEGDLFVSDLEARKVREYRPTGQPKSEVGEELGVGGGDFPTVSHIALRGNGTASSSRMGAFQPADGGTLFVLSSSFDPTFRVIFNDLNVIRPKRAFYEIAPANPVPAGPVTLMLREGPPGGTAIMFLSGGSVSPEVKVVSAGVPFFFGVDFGLILAIQPVPLDGNGEFATSGVHHGGVGSGAVQAALIDSTGQLLGTSEALTIVLQ